MDGCTVELYNLYETHSIDIMNPHVEFNDNKLTDMLRNCHIFSSSKPQIENVFASPMSRSY